MLEVRLRLPSGDPPPSPIRISGRPEKKNSVVRRHRPISDGWIALQELSAFVTKFPPDTIRIHLKVVLLFLCVSGSPDVFEDHSACTDPSHMLGQVGEEIKLLWGKIQRIAFECRLVMDKVEMERTDVNLGWSFVTREVEGSSGILRGSKARYEEVSRKEPGEKAQDLYVRNV